VRGARADQFVEFGLDRDTVAVLGVLDEEHHQEGDDRRAGVDDELPGVGIAEHGPCYRPRDDDGAAHCEGDRLPGDMRHGGRGAPKSL
jgi:hypothetical protein